MGIMGIFRIMGNAGLISSAVVCKKGLGKGWGFGCYGFRLEFRDFEFGLLGAYG